ncbi:MAG: hypothetical protein JWM64_2077 [Frankiales bacterium]|nr:hypothetical protein [Frankiales bacterium]
MLAVLLAVLAVLAVLFAYLLAYEQVAGLGLPLDEDDPVYDCIPNRPDHEWHHARLEARTRASERERKRLLRRYSDAG